MRFLFAPLVFLVFLNASVKAQNTDSLFITAAIKKLQHSREYTLQTAKLMPEAQYTFRPQSEEINFGEQLLHLSANMGWLCASYLSNSKNPVTKEDSKLLKKEAIISVLDKAYDFALNVLTHFDTKSLADPVTFFAGPMNKLQIINLLNDHQTHHRAQMLVYLRLNGIKPPAYIGW
ncbi:MAG: hypothetical protein NVSMB7_04880 [Chitinophagaceae bacterium]